MGPFPHDAPPAEISAANPAGTDGFEFVEYAHPEPKELHALFRLMGFVPVARHKRQAITVYRQGDINYIVNEEPGSHATQFRRRCTGRARRRWPSGSSTPSARYRRAIELGAEPADPRDGGKTLDVPAIRASAEASSISSTGTVRRDRPTQTSSTGSENRIRGPRASASTTSTT